MKKVISVFILVILLCGCVLTTTQAVNYETYTGNISSTYLDLIDNYTVKIPLDNNYVFFRASNYEYYLAYSENLEYNSTDNLFICDTDINIIKIDTISGNIGYNNYYSYDTFIINEFSLNPADRIVYSNLGDYPLLIESGDYYEIIQTFIIIIISLFALLWFIFRKCIRR